MKCVLPLGMSCLFVASALAKGTEYPAAPLGHRDLQREHATLSREAFGGGAEVSSQPTWSLGQSSRPRREVFAYLPYWSYSTTQPYVGARWDLITVLAWFAVSLDGKAQIVARNGWGNSTTRTIVEEAQARGIKVVLTITNFEADQIAALVAPAQRSRTIDVCLSLMQELHADGLNIDFEFVPLSAKRDFVDFMGELKDAVVALGPNGHEGHVTLAGPAVDWTGAYDYDALLEGSDGIMVMAYGYHWQGGNPGPTAALYSAPGFASRSVSWTIDDYLTYGGWENRAKLIIGLPWYGRKWLVAQPELPTEALGSGSSLTYKQAEPLASQYGKHWHELMYAAYFHQPTGTQFYQAWYDDARSFQAKVAYLDEMDLGGVGIWALGYEGERSDLWSALSDVLGPEDDHEPPIDDVSNPDEPDSEDTSEDMEVALPEDDGRDGDTPEEVEPSDDDAGPIDPQPNLPEHPDATTPAYPERPIRSSQSSERYSSGCEGASSSEWCLGSLAALALTLRARLKTL